MNVIDSMELVTSEIQLGKLTRRNVRQILHRIRSNRSRDFDKWYKERAPGLKIIFEKQFRYVNEELMDWKNFTFLWDVHPQFPLMTVASGEWVRAGGGFSDYWKKRGIIVCEPTAFTGQKI